MNASESNVLNTLASVLAITREVNHACVQVLVDSYHLALAGEAPDVVLDAGRAVRHVHLARTEARAFPRAADPWLEAVAARLRATGYEERCSVEAYSSDFEADAPLALSALRALFRTHEHE